MGLGGYVYNAVVWTESALEFLKTAATFLETARELHDGTSVQVVLAPGQRGGKEVEELFSAQAPPRVVLTLDTVPSQAGIERFPKYCANTLLDGIQKIHAIANETPGVSSTGPLGILIPRLGVPPDFIDYAKGKLPEEKGGVRWNAVYAQEYVFLGPDLPHLAEQILIHYGVDPERALWVCGLTPPEISYSTDFGILTRGIKHDAKAVHVGPGPAVQDRQILEWIPEKAFIELGGTDANRQAASLHTAVVAKPISLHYDCDRLRSRTVFEDLQRSRQIASQNRKRAFKIIQRWNAQQIPRTKGSWLANASLLARDGYVFDNKSGGIAFDSYEWETNIKRVKENPWQRVIEYFEHPLGGLWQKDRPNLARRLETPTKTILRGEEYYCNLANLPPVERLNKLRESLDNVFRALDLRTVFHGWVAPWKWKLALAVCDQLRNYTLQFNWFSYQISRHALTQKEPAVQKLASIITRVTDAAVGLYYAALFWCQQLAQGHLDILRQSHEQFDEAIVAALKVVSAKGAELNGDMTFTNRFVRRWREADHPGENLLTAAQAIEFCNERKVNAVVAVGISWGGIELPLAFRHIRNIIYPDLKLPEVLAADYSHYRKERSLDVDTVPYFDLVAGGTREPQAGDPVVIFDDNSLTGLTMQGVHDDLLKRKCNVLAVFLTRISGGRRYGQMRMKDHGVMNPALVGDLVLGFLGETPFALTWSREKYENPMGIFSLARRRILELLYANSSVERYDREGF